MADYTLHEAAREGKVLTIKGLLEQDPKQAFVKDLDGRIPLHWAVAFTQLEVASMLLNPGKFSGKKIEVEIDDYLDEAGWTALHIAASVGNLEMVKLLLTHEPKPDVNIQTSTGVTPIHLATSKKHVEVAKELFNAGASLRTKDKRSQYPIHRAAAVGCSALVQFFGENSRSPLNAKDIQGWTPMHHALAEGFGDVAILLVSLGADPAVEDSEGKTPLKVAVDDIVAKYFKAECSKLGVDLI
jgi:26S proteasome non-ATPase regulatory subunit 10